MNLCYSQFIRRIFVFGFLSATTKGLSFGELRNRTGISSASNLSKFQGGNFQTSWIYQISEEARPVTWTIGTAQDFNGTFERERDRFYDSCLGLQRPIHTGKADSISTAEHNSDTNHKHTSVISPGNILSVLLVQQKSVCDNSVATLDATTKGELETSETSDRLKRCLTVSYDDQVSDVVELNVINKSGEGIANAVADIEDGQNSNGSTEVSLPSQDDGDDVHILRQGRSYDDDVGAKITVTVDGEDATAVTNRTLKVGDRLVISVDVTTKPNHSIAEPTQPPTTQFYWKETHHSHLKQFFGRKCRTVGVCSIVLTISKRIPRIEFLPRETRRAVNVGARIAYAPPTESLDEMTTFFLANPIDYATLRKSYKKSTKRKSGSAWFVSYNRIGIVCLAAACSFSLYVLQHYLRK